MHCIWENQQRFCCCCKTLEKCKKPNLSHLLHIILQNENHCNWAHVSSLANHADHHHHHLLFLRSQWIMQCFPLDGRNHSDPPHLLHCSHFRCTKFLSQKPFFPSPVTSSLVFMIIMKWSATKAKSLTFTKAPKTLILGSHKLLNPEP